MILFFKLLLAHIIGDFVLQPEKWVKDKEKNKIHSMSLYYHIAVHAIALLLILEFSRAYFWGYIIIIGSHLIIDIAKIYMLRDNNQKLLFFLDQMAHLLIIALVVYMYSPFNIDFNIFYSQEIPLLVLSILTITFVSSVIIKILVSHWTKDLGTGTESLENAGKYIGMLERLFVFTFLIFEQWEAIGFLLAAKSVFRFGDLSKAKDRKLTEYVLIGTLLSFGFAIATGFVYEYFIDIIPILK